jgi:hypothetical protein
MEQYIRPDFNFLNLFSNSNFKTNKFEIQGFFCYYVNVTVEVRLVKIFFSTLAPMNLEIFISY